LAPGAFEELVSRTDCGDGLLERLWAVGNALRRAASSAGAAWPLSATA